MHTLRLHCTGRTAVGLKPVTGTCPAACWDADDLEIAVWIDAGTRSTTGSPESFDVSTIATLRLECRETPETEAMFFTAKELTSFTACTFTDFKAGDGEHATFSLTASETNFEVGVEKVWISIVAELTDGSRYTCTAGYMAVVQNGDSTALAPLAPSPVSLYATVVDLDALDVRVTELETNGVGGSDLVVRIVDATADATDEALHLAYVPLALTIPAASPAGFYGGLESHTPGTVKLVLPTGFEIYYDDLPAGTTGRPVVAFRGGRIAYAIIAPNRLIIRGDYVSTADTWHPTDAGDSLLGFWQAGPDVAHGGHISFPCADTESVTFTTDLMMRWEALWGSRANARFVYDWLGNVESGGDQGTSPGDYAPILVADATFAGGYAYKIREGSSTSHIMRAKDTSGDIAPTAPCRIYIAIRQTGTLPQSATTLLRVNDQAAYSFGSKSALWWRASPYGYQLVTNTSGGSFGAKGTGAYNFTTHESTTDAILLTLLIDANGGGTLYSGTQLISNPLTSNTAALLSFLQFYTGLNSRIGGFAVINGTASDLTAEITAMEALLIS